MTICLGALGCDNEKEGVPAVILASDRMVTWANMTEFEHRVPKVRNLGRAAVAIAGDALAGARIVDEVNRALRNDDAKGIEELAKLLARKFEEVRLEYAEGNYLRARGLTLSDYYEMHQKLMPQIVGMLDNNLANFDLGVQMIVAGVDQTGGHLYTVANPGQVVCHDMIGHVAIGSGTIHAQQSMIGFRHTASTAVKETIAQVFISKRRAELAPCVGNQTDLVVITADGTKHLGETDLQVLDEIDHAMSLANRDVVGQRTREFRPTFLEGLDGSPVLAQPAASE